MVAYAADLATRQSARIQIFKGSDGEKLRKPKACKKSS
jgi:hypothetical protein